ncbi:AfsR/SARP family transcriptional regulator [Actinophytocola gossypii]|uniref:AfsR/SARP family transcriptional regulator n=1 Tax=Actinophytocola gossypii TaxID=2812003 RepID=A0ABT2J2A1_9PSEU|nr:AfsR/SARP family transcriptional regulator [Actinophytocola gossypii]MCT2581983.1 AfsR/SARP family transcriptional regulator [Actinophytocola gossypii]
MQINVLGPLEAYVDGRAMTPSAAKHRQVLALLALHANEVVSVRVLLEELWGTRPPETSQQTLQTYIFHLRQRIGTALGMSKTEVSKTVLVTQHTGYTLRIGPQDLDACRYEQLAHQGRRDMAREDYRAASDTLRRALEMWRGPALVDVPTGHPLSVHVNRLEESRLGVLEDCVDADLCLGRHHVLLSELAELTARFPMNERLCAQFMIAQYRSGRQWRSLEIFRDLRTTMVDELGLEPSVWIQRLQRAILNADPVLHRQHTSGQLLTAS